MTLHEQILNERIFVSPFEASKMIGVSRSYVYRLVKHQRLQGTRELPVRITTRSLKDYLQEVVHGMNPAT